MASLPEQRTLHFPNRSIRSLSYPSVVSLFSTLHVFDNQPNGSSIPPLPNIQARHIQLVIIIPEFITQETQYEPAPTRDASLPLYPQANPSFIVHIPSRPHLPLRRQPPSIPEEYHTVSLHSSFSAQVTPENLESGEREDLWKHIWEIFDNLDSCKNFFGLAVTAVVGMLSSDSLSGTTEMRIVAVASLFAVAAICNGILLRRTCPRISTIILLTGIASMMLAFFVFVSCYVPPELKWVPWLAWIATFFPFILALLLHRMSTANPE